MTALGFLLAISWGKVYNCRSMKKDFHPSTYRPVVFKDLNNGQMFLTRSTVASDETVKYEDGKEYPLINVHISSASHPFYTGQEKMVDIEGRVDKFKARQKAAAEKKEAQKDRAGKTRDKKQTEAQKIGAPQQKS